MAALWATWPVGVAGVVAWATGRYGFSPTDDEFVLAGSWRILNGEIPHRDVVSARPMGSSLLHLIDFALPGPLFLDGRLTTTLEFVLIAAALLMLALRGAGMGRRRTPRRIVLVAMGTTAVILVNLQTFPLTPWHTVDGLACTAVGWFLVDDGLVSGSAGRLRFGLFLTGFATICKQSFAPAPLMALVMVVVPGRGRCPCRFVRTVAANALVAVCAPIAYLAWIALAGGLREGVYQMSSSPPVWGRPMFVGFWHAASADPWADATAAAFLAAVAAWAFGRTRRVSSMTCSYASAAAITVIVVGTLLGTTLGEPFGSGVVPFSGHRLEASSVVWWMCAVLVVADALVERRVFFPALATCALAWIASLSWGYALPALLQGSLAASAIVLTWHRVRSRAWGPPRFRMLLQRVGPVVSLAVLTGVSGSVVFGQRAMHEYRDAPRTELTASLGVAGPRGRAIRTSSATAAYMREVSLCVKDHPAEWTAILPDSAAAYPLLSLRNPFPSDWILPQELVGDADSRILRAADRIDRSGDYLILFRDEDPLLDRIRSRLTAEPVRCGSMVGVWSPQRGVRTVSRSIGGAAASSARERQLGSRAAVHVTERRIGGPGCDSGRRRFVTPSCRRVCHGSNMAPWPMSGIAGSQAGTLRRGGGPLPRPR